MGVNDRGKAAPVFDATPRSKDDLVTSTCTVAWAPGCKPDTVKGKLAPVGVPTVIVPESTTGAKV
jgi:hypothetical protein